MTLNRIQPGIGHAVMTLALGCFLSTASAATREHREQGAPVQGVANLTLTMKGPEIQVELVSPAATLVGFEHAPRSQGEREALGLARENLKAGDAMIRFNTNAACRLIQTKVESDLPVGPDTAVQPPSPNHDAHAQANISARYRFQCDHPRALESAALGLFVGFPALERVLVHYATGEGEGAAELTKGNPVVSFVPF